MGKFLFAFVLFTVVPPVNAQQPDVFDVARKGTLPEIAALYKEHPDAIDSVNDKKASPLILAAYLGNTEVGLFLADKVKDIDYNCGYGTAVMAAVMSGNIAILEKLVSLKANLNLSDSHGETALLYAVLFNKNDVAKLLIKAGADISLKDDRGKTALDIANFNKNTELIILLDQ
jgi:ankyrin repeat protein